MPLSYRLVRAWSSVLLELSQVRAEIGIGNAGECVSNANV